jgi:hypothetical protein
LRKTIYKVRIWHTKGIFKVIDYEESGWTNKTEIRKDLGGKIQQIRKRNKPLKTHVDIVRA